MALVALQQTLDAMHTMANLTLEQRALHGATFERLFVHFLNPVNRMRFVFMDTEDRKRLITKLRRDAIAKRTRANMRARQQRKRTATNMESRWK